MSIVTQDQINSIYDDVKKEWKRMRAEFKGSDVLFVMSREAIDFLGHYEIMREQIQDEGFELPPLDDKIKVTLS